MPELLIPDTLDPTTIGPGIYDNIPPEVYHAIPACSQSALNTIRTRSPAHWKAIADGLVGTDSEAKALGSAIHAAMLTPEDYAARYALGPDVDLRTKIGKEQWEAFAAENEGKILVRGKDGELIRGMREALERWASRYLRAKGRSEVTVVWDERVRLDDGDGVTVRNKIRIDRLVETDPATLVDLKSAAIARLDYFTGAFGKYGYDIQASQYITGCAVHSIPVGVFAFVVVENQPYHGVSVFTVAPSALQAGSAERQRLLKIYATCMRDNHWPGYPTVPQEINLRDYDARNRGAAE